MKAFASELIKRDPSSDNPYLDLLDLDNENERPRYVTQEETLGGGTGGDPGKDCWRRGGFR